MSWAENLYMCVSTVTQSNGGVCVRCDEVDAFLVSMECGSLPFPFPFRDFIDDENISRAK